MRRCAVIGDQGTLAGHHVGYRATAGVSPRSRITISAAKEQLLIATIPAFSGKLRDDAVSAMKRLDAARKGECPDQREFSRRSVRAGDGRSLARLLFGGATVEEVRRLLVIYARRLRSNLLAGLRALCPADDAERIAEGAAAMIDGLYIPAKFEIGAISIEASVALTEDYVNAHLRASDGKGSPPRVCSED